MQQLQTEVTTGLASNTREHLNGSYAQLTDIERNISVLTGYRTVGNEARIAIDTMQATLTGMQSRTSDLAANLHLATQAAGQTSLELATQDAETVFRSVVSALNASVAGRALFSGVASDSAALANADALLNSLRTAISGETTLTGVDAQLYSWFNMPGGGFETIGYQGSLDEGNPFKLADDVQISVALKADKQEFRDVLKSVAKAALAMDPSLGFAPDLSRTLLATAAGELTTMQSGLVDLAAGVGLAQELVEDTTARNEAALSSLQIARNELLGVDGYEAASKLEAAQSQVELMYAVTVRASRLTLLDFMR
ncbi:flagellin [Primorskyibacter aestuariivivens]|uniref:flagellin n=1 Tax=Primorskyibacter aestuariivivens TaxID=1888912 RepID=UPI002301A0C0|nr:flagellin [Primorskyibacter aestuariivivens]MDA7427662.1 flagellin [Primorskyibacter aestuariivivens]